MAGMPARGWSSDTLTRIEQTHTINLGHRESSVPFSYYDNKKQVIGYSHDLMLRVAEHIRHAVGLPALTLKLVPVTAQNRIPLMVNGAVDLECGSTTHNVERARQVLFSTSFFVISTRLMTHRQSGINDFADLAGKRVVVTAGTTSERLLRTFVEETATRLQFITAREHSESFQLLESGRVDAFMMDDALLYGERAKANRPEDWVVVGTPMSSEAYGCMLRKDDHRLKAIVDRELTRLMTSGEALALYTKWFQQPIPPKNLNMNWPPHDKLLQLYRAPNDQPLQ